MTPSRYFATALALYLVLSPAVGSANLGRETEAPDNRLEDARGLIAQQDWKNAAQLLEMLLVAKPESADAHNFLGYTYRKMGKLEDAFREYAEALRLDPRHRFAREYLGEAYLLAGDPAKAEQQLAELGRICSPIPCEEYKDLKRALEDYRKAHPKP